MFFSDNLFIRLDFNYVMKEIILVDIHDTVLGSMEKQLVHEKSLLHRAFSVLIFNSDNKMLIHKRAYDKYHCGGLWTNACCSHPNFGESLEDAVKRRLFEELGYKDLVCTHVGHILYKSSFVNGLTEYEYDHIFVSQTDTDCIDFDRSEIAQTSWVSLNELVFQIRLEPHMFTPWFKAIIRKLANTDYHIPEIEVYELVLDFIP
jgi:isopentenyl-diphosphate Delta-isomerase